MNRIIIEHTLDIMETQQITVPQGSRVLSLTVINNRIKIFILETMDKRLVSKTFFAFPTGKAIPTEDFNCIFVGTVTLDYEPTVGHPFSQITLHIFEQH